ncbi:MAG TPA: ABC transporter ATP-binding protein [Anaeromyxobacter sp.]|nr:ABC transporter ATP-binding protein [Anaeromyxobacter sp.]
MLRLLRPHLKHLASRRRALAALFALGLVASAAALANPLVGKAFIDAVASRRDFAAVPRVALALVALAVGDLLLGALSRWIHARLSAGVLADLRAELFASCLRAPLERIEVLRHGDLLTRFGSDLPRVEVLLVDGLLGAAQNVLFLVVAAVILVHLSPALALWSFGGVALALAAAAAFRAPVQAKAAEVRGAMADVSHFMSERLAALRPIRFHRTEEEERERLTAESGRWSRAVVGYQMLDSAVSGAPGLLLTLALAWIYLLGGRLLEGGQITLGTFVAFVLYQARLFAPANAILGLVRNLQESRVSVERVGEVLLAANDPPARACEGCAGERGEIVYDGVTFAHPGKPAVLREVSLRVLRGERIAIFGASGAGKSTLVQLLFGLRAPQSGAIRVDGLPPEALRAGGRRDVLGYAGAEPFLLHASVEENLRYGNPRATPEALASAVRLAEADSFVDALPEKSRTVIGGRGLSLSDGQRQRLGLARLFLRDPQVLVLDEAFSALDLETEARVRRNLWQAFPDRTVIAISHRPVGLAEFDRVLFLRDGRLSLVDPRSLEALLTTCPPAPRSREEGRGEGQGHGGARGSGDGRRVEGGST